jgi:hypothetical protein
MGGRKDEMGWNIGQRIEEKWMKQDGRKDEGRKEGEGGKWRKQDRRKDEESG